MKVFEPSELERGHLTSHDHDVRKTDIPERFQLRQIPVTPTRIEGDDRTFEKELDDEAKWIYHHAFYRPYISNQVNSIRLLNLFYMEIKDYSITYIVKILEIL